MPRWTEIFEEMKRISELPDFVAEWAFRVASIELTSGARLDGTILPGRVGNNAGEGGRWAYYGSIGLRMDGEDVEIDFLDVEAAHPL